MIPIPNNYDSARAYDGNALPTLPLGGHICKVHSARMGKNLRIIAIICIMQILKISVRLVLMRIFFLTKDF